MKNLYALLWLPGLLLFMVHTGYCAEKKPLSMKLKSIIIKNIRYDDVAIDKTVADLKKRVLKDNPAADGINIIVALSRNDKPEKHRVNIELSNIPLEALIDYIARSAGLHYFFRGRTVVIAGRDIAAENMEIRAFRVKSHTVSTLKKAIRIKDK